MADVADVAKVRRERGAAECMTGGLEAKE